MYGCTTGSYFRISFNFLAEDKFIGRTIKCDIISCENVGTAAQCECSNSSVTSRRPLVGHAEFELLMLPRSCCSRVLHRCLPPLLLALFCFPAAILIFDNDGIRHQPRGIHHEVIIICILRY